VRQAVELGADIIKSDPTSDVAKYHQVVEVAGGVPVLVRGGGKTSDREILDRTAALLEEGVAGVVYGRNVIQHSDPEAMTRALMALIHEQASVDDALAIANGHGLSHRPAAADRDARTSDVIGAED
jgi:DhnA family fructose-bisphosphate aldolase class Ia